MLTQEFKKQKQMSRGNQKKVRESVRGNPVGSLPAVYDSKYLWKT